jgi:hypothetical protein
MSRYLSGAATGGEIDDCIDAWHERPGKTELFEFLGMTREEYAAWLRDPDSLPRIARSRRTGLPLRDLSEAAAPASANEEGTPGK